MESKEPNNVLRTSRLNGENIAGAAFILLASLFMAAGQVNAVFAVLYPADLLLLAIGIALLALGYRTWRNETKVSIYGNKGHY